MIDLPVFVLKRKQWVDVPLSRVFPFFEKPENLALITPPQLGFRLLTPSPVQMERGRIIDYTIRVAGVRLHWTTLISSYQPPYCFVDEQLSGPYGFWHHTHRFQQAGSGTLLLDEVRYAMPVYLPGLLASALCSWQIRPRLNKIFDYRQRQFQRLFGGPETEFDTNHCKQSKDY